MMNEIDETFAVAIQQINELVNKHQIDERQLDFILLIKTELKIYLDEYADNQTRH